MNKRFGVALGAGAAMLAAAAFSTSLANAAVIYDSIPTYDPGSNVVSEGYTCCQLTELGDYIAFAGAERQLTTVTLTLSNWNDDGFTHPLTLNLYNVATGPTAGSLIASVTQNVTAPPHVPNGHGGIAFDISFDFSGVIVPDEIMFGLTFGISPNDPGPWDSLNFGLWDYGFDGLTIPVGTDIGTMGLSTIVYGRTNSSPDWTFNVGNDLEKGYAPAIRFEADHVPEPSTVAVVALALLSLLALGRQRTRRNVT